MQEKLENLCFCTCTHTVHTLSLHPSIRSIVFEIWLSGLDTFIMYQFSNFLFTYFVLLHNILISFCRKNQQFPNLNPQMVTLAYQRVPVPATLLTQWTLATIISRKHRAVVMAVREISLTIMRKKNVGEQLSGFSGSKGKKMITQFHSNIPTRLPSRVAE